MNSDGTWSIDIEAPPSTVWELVSDPTRTPEWSPVCHTVEWVGDVRSATIGARFTGKNKLNGARWSRLCRVSEVEAGRAFAWTTSVKGRDSTHWRYELEPTPEGTRLHESYAVGFVPLWVRVLARIPGMRAKSDRDRDWNVRTSLARLKALAEAPT